MVRDVKTVRQPGNILSSDAGALFDAGFESSAVGRQLGQATNVHPARGNDVVREEKLVGIAGLLGVYAPECGR